MNGFENNNSLLVQKKMDEADLRHFINQRKWKIISALGFLIILSLAVYTYIEMLRELQS